MDQHHLQQSLQAVKAAAPLLAQRSDDEINGLLLDLADRVVDSEEEILAANSNKAKDIAPGLQAMTNLCQVLMSSNEFLYID